MRLRTYKSTDWSLTMDPPGADLDGRQKQLHCSVSHGLINGLYRPGMAGTFASCHFCEITFRLVYISPKENRSKKYNKKFMSEANYAQE